MSHTLLPRRRKDDQKESHHFRSLQLLNIYRLIIATLLFSFNFVEITFIGKVQPGQTFFLLSSFYLLFSVTCLIISMKAWLTLNKQVHINVVVDVISISLFTLMSGGISSGWGTLILAPIAGASLLLPGQTALLFASYGTVALILQEFYGDITGLITDTSYSQTGLLGIALFATAFLAITLAKRVSESVALAEKRGIDLANLAQLNHHLINRIESGIIVVDENDAIKLMNRAAYQLLNLTTHSANLKLRNVCIELYHAHQQWLKMLNNQASGDLFQITRNNQSTLQARISKVGLRAEDKGSVIYITDTSELNRQIQESKLASLGRLTASIAHEIRNPLGAISHAAQLLDESEQLCADNKRLANIIHDHTNRLNKIIESILRLSRKQGANLESFYLKPWLEAFVTEFQELNKLADGWCRVDIESAQMQVFSDTNHLHQVVWNLCTNAVKYAKNEQENQPIVYFNAYINPATQTSYLDIVDKGPGISNSDQEKLFEPFYTTSSTGTGLGLYISRELCLSTGGDLSYSNIQSVGSCFKIRFAKSDQI